MVFGLAPAVCCQTTNINHTLSKQNFGSCGNCQLIYTLINNILGKQFSPTSQDKQPGIIMSSILVIDQGTHASRAMLFSGDGQVLAQAEQTIALQRRSPEEIEQDPAEILASVQQVIQRLPQNLLRQAQHCCLTSQRSTVLAWHAQTGKALSPALSWQDRRSLHDLQQFHPLNSRIRAITGLPLSPHYGAGKFRWLLQHCPPVQQALEDGQLHLGMLVSYLLHHLLEQPRHLIDHSNAHRSLLFDLHRLDWSAELCQLFAIPQHCLPECLPMQYDYGQLKDYGIPITTVCGDQSAALFAQGPISSGVAHINIGTGAFILAPCEAPITETDLLCGIALSDQHQHGYLLEGTVNGAGAALSWAQQQFPVEQLFQHLPGWLANTDTVPLFVNTIGGLGSPWWKDGGPAHFTDDCPLSTPQRYVAIVESVVFLLQHNLEQMQQQLDIQHIQVGGGLSKLDGLCQKLADLSALPVQRPRQTEATARGAAWLAAGRPQHWFSQAMPTTFTPHQQPGLQQRYRNFIDVIRDLP